MGVRYNDHYVRKDGKWLIAQRTSNFMWQDVKTTRQLIGSKGLASFNL